MATAGSWSTNWSTGKITSDGKWWDSNRGSWYASTETVPSSAFSYKVPTFWFDEEKDKLPPMEEFKVEIEEKDHLSGLKELFEI